MEVRENGNCSTFLHCAFPDVSSKGFSKIFNNDNKFGYQMCPQRDSQRFLTMTINVDIMPAASEQRLFIQSGLNAAAGRKETELIYYFSPDFHSARFFTRPTFSVGPFFR